jgi:hypothetical protein
LTVAVLASCSGPSAVKPEPGAHPFELAIEPTAIPEASEPTPAPDEVEADSGYEIYPGVTVDEAWVDCRVEDDCVIVEAGCCDHCNGGAMTAVARPYADRARQLLARTACESPCTTVSCDTPEAHRLVCMTRACHIEDLEDEVHERIWGGGSDPDEVVPEVERNE